MPIYGGASRGITTGTVLQISNLSDTVTRTDIVVSAVRDCVLPCGGVLCRFAVLVLLPCPVSFPCRTSVRRVAPLSPWSCWGAVWLRWSSSPRTMHRRPTGGTTDGILMVRLCALWRGACVLCGLTSVGLSYSAFLCAPISFNSLPSPPLPSPPLPLRPAHDLQTAD